MGKRTLNIKNLVPRKHSHYRQGYYKLLNTSKYIGDPNKIILRSGYERKFATYCDTNDRVISWSSEPFPIPYFNPVDNSMKPYNIDFYAKVKISEDKIVEYIIEVKPAKQLKQPVVPSGRVTEKRLKDYNKQLETYLINMSKFNAAKVYAKNRNWEFLIVTEQFLFNQ